MTINVLIERDGDGRLHAYVTEHRPDGMLQKGDDLLSKRVVRHQGEAVLECGEQIRKLFKLFDPPPIHYTYPEEGEKPW